MTKFLSPDAYEVKLLMVSMPRDDIGQIDFQTDHDNFSFLMSRDDFQRLARRISQLLLQVPLSARKRRANRKTAPPSI